MSYYRLYFMDGFHGHIERFEDFDADDDREAISATKPRRGALALELWCGARKVARFDALDLASQLVAERRKLKAVKARVEPTENTENTQPANRSA